MNKQHPFFGFAKGYAIAGILGGLGLGIMAGPNLRQLIPSDQVLSTGVIGPILIMISIFANWFLDRKSRRVKSADSTLSEQPQRE